LNQPDSQPIFTCKPETLFAELHAEGLPIESIDENGSATYKRTLTENETSLAAQVIKMHDPHRAVRTLSEELLEVGVSLQARLEALWMAVIEQDDCAAQEIQQTITTIKARLPHGSD